MPPVGEALSGRMRPSRARVAGGGFVRAGVGPHGVVRVRAGVRAGRMRAGRMRAGRMRVRAGVRARLMWAPVAAVVAALVASGCATIPTSGVPQSAPAPPPAEGNGTNCCGLVVRGWRPGLLPTEVVSDFLLASASFAHDHQIARGYLTPAASKLWRPGSVVTILAQTPKVIALQQRLAGTGDHTARVMVSGEAVATLDSSGQYRPVGGGGAADQVFTLGSVGGRLLITSLPAGQGRVSHELLLTRSLFHLVYASYNLYFEALRGGVLVPDPVFVPADSANPDTTLIRDLLQNPKGWLSGAAVTAFPRGAQLKKVQIVPGPPEGKTAIVDIHLPPGVSRSSLEPMAAQLVWTLTSAAYNQPLAQAVEIKINGHPWSPAGSSGPVLDTSDFREHVPGARANGALYFVSANGSVKMLTSQAARSTAVPGQAGTGQVPVNAVAVSPDGKYLAGVAGPDNTLYISNLAAATRHAGSRAGNMEVRLTGSSLAAPSWDSSDDLWIAGSVHGSSGVWVLRPGGGPALRVTLPGLNGPVTGLRVAPDGVRIALIVGRGAAAHLLLGSVVRDGAGFSVEGTVPLGPGLTGVTSVIWYGRDHVLAVTQGKLGGQLWNVPVNGDQPTQVAAPPDMTSITAEGGHGPLYLGLSSGRLEKSVGLGEPWTDSGAGRDVTYPG